MTAATTIHRTMKPAARPAPASAGLATLGTSVLAATLPLRFILAGFGSLAGVILLLVIRPDLLATYHYSQYVVAATHLCTLGFITTIIMGALYQLVPVALETPLYSQRLAKWQFVFHLVGFTGMVGMFWVWNLKQVGHFGSVLAVGVALFVYNLGRTLARVRRWNVIAGGIVSALVWLSLTVLAGLALAAAKCTYESGAQLDLGNPVSLLAVPLQRVALAVARLDAIPLMHAHAHLGVVGFFLMMIVSVSYKLVPMFTLSGLQNERRAWWSVALLNAGLAGLGVTLALGSAFKVAFGIIVAWALATYGVEIAALLRARKRGPLDWGLRYFLTAAGLLAPVAALGLLLCWPGLPATALTTQLENVYGFLGLVGVVTFTILGFLYKIVPFLVWYHTYSPLVGRSQVPALADLYSARLQAVGYWLFLSGLVALSVSSALGHQPAVRGAALVLAASLAVFAANLAKMLAHLFRPCTLPRMARTR